MGGEWEKEGVFCVNVCERGREQTPRTVGVSLSLRTVVIFPDTEPSQRILIRAWGVQIHSLHPNFHGQLRLFETSTEMNGRALPSLIPEDAETQDHFPRGEMNGYQQRLQMGEGGEAEVPVSKSQRRKSDVKVYKEFCDFYARL